MKNTIKKTASKSIKQTKNSLPQPKNPYTKESNYGLKNNC